ncbi:MAG: ParA family protein, partial [Nostocales cyanobacterium]
MPAKVVSLINLKGGVAKTTTTVQLAECLASQFSKNVLV